MGLTLIHKGEGAVKRNPRIALVLAGGAVSGGAFKVGGLKALNDFLVGRRVTDFDMYVGLSAGSVLAIPLAAGITPDEMVQVLEGTHPRFDQLRPLDFYGLNWQEFVTRPSQFVYDAATYAPGVALELIRSLPSLPRAFEELRSGRFLDWRYRDFEEAVSNLIDHVSLSRELPSLTDHIPSGIFDNASLERWMRRGLEGIEMPNDFEAFEAERACQLYISACNLDTAERVIFGADEEKRVTISEAMQASTALPGFYRPVRLDGVDYVDGGVRSTANIDVAIEKGADLIICYNPFRPFVNDVEGNMEEEGQYLSDRGMKLVINQVFRTLLHTRLKLGLQQYLLDERFQGDIVLLEPQEHDAKFFAVNPLAFWKRGEAMRHGFESVNASIEQNFDILQSVLGRYGLRLSRAAARQKAERAREDLGWNAAEAESSLRLVGS